jgi:hypothetical protein
MNSLIPVALLGWVPLVVLTFLVLPARRAVFVSFIAGWLFLPESHVALPGFPEYGKTITIPLAAMFATVAFKPGVLLSIRPSWIDIPMVVWCLCPFASAVTNGLGIYDGFSAVAENLVIWGFPYILGRAYLRTLDDFRELATLLFIGGLIYVPFCLYEIRMSPQLARYLYGIEVPAGMEYENELGKWGSRPRVFMGSGLALGMYMGVACISGIWLWTSGALTKVWGMRVEGLIAMLAFTTLFCKNLGATALLGAGLFALFTVGTFRSRIVIYCLMVAAPLYIYGRVGAGWSGEPIANLAGMIHHERAESLQFRLDNEDLLVAKAMQKPIYGWGRWGRARVYRLEDGKDLTITDGMWIIMMGNTGLVGLCSMTACLLLPTLVFAIRCPVRIWMHPAIAAAAALSMLPLLFMVDNLFNAMLDPIYLLACGGITRLLKDRALPTEAAVRSANARARRLPTAGMRPLPSAALGRGPAGFHLN